jgi:GH24 family phage-related lysozyme (muramidase)
MMIDPKLVADIKAAEACKLTSYKDSEGLWTVGWGHLLDQNLFGAGYTITPDQAASLLQTDLESAQNYAQKLPEWTYLDTPCRQNAVIELCFNMRGKWLLFVNTRHAIDRQDWTAAHDGLLSSLWATQVHATRANRLANYLLTGQYP